jgi:hypothetical protein
LKDSNDYAGCSRHTKFKPLVLGEIQAADDTLRRPRRYHKHPSKGQKEKPTPKAGQSVAW